MTFETEAERLLFGAWQTAEDLRNSFPHMIDSLRGEFQSDIKHQPVFHVYENGQVASRTLLQTAKGKNPTVGVILPGSYSFPTGDNKETLTVLDGELEASVNNGPRSVLRRDGTIVASSDTLLHLEVRQFGDAGCCFYVCRYTPRQDELTPSRRRSLQAKSRSDLRTLGNLVGETGKPTHSLRVGAVSLEEPLDWEDLKREVGERVTNLLLGSGETTYEGIIKIHKTLRGHSNKSGLLALRNLGPDSYRKIVDYFARKGIALDSSKPLD